MNKFFTIAAICFGLCLTNQAFAYFSHNIQDPRQTWKSASGVIDESTVSVKPHGTYTEYGVYLTFSAKAYYRQHVSDTFEVQFYFDLPENAIITDSWLWVGNSIVQAKLYDRNRATTIYESIVNRRKDPSILYKNSATQYELRVFPMAGNETRKVKITYLLPTNLQTSGSFNLLPVTLLKNSLYQFKVNVMAYPDSSMGYTLPTFVESGLPVLTYNATAGAFTATLSNQQMAQISSLSVKYNSVISGSRFFSTEQGNGNSGFYQLAFQPRDFFNVQSSKKLLLLVDYSSSQTNLSKQAVLDGIKSTLLQHVSTGDSFNVVLSNLTPYRVSENWLPTDSATINTVFNNLLAGNLASYSNLQQLLSNAVAFMNLHGKDGKAILFSPAERTLSPQDASLLISDITNAMTQRFPIHVLNYISKSYTNHYFSNKNYLGNEYFLWNLANATGGNYMHLTDNRSYYYNNITFKPFSDGAIDIMSKVDGLVRNINVSVTTNGGMGFAAYVLDKGAVGLSNSAKAVGRFTGDYPMDVTVSGIIGSNFYYKTFTVNAPPHIDTMAKKIWMGKYLAELEVSNNNDNALIREIVDSSLKHRILTLYTAFLALEPSDTTQVCASCEDETSNFPAVSIKDISDSLALKIKAYPNPFQSTVYFEAAGDVEIVSITIMDLSGRLVKEITADGGTNKLLWDGSSNEGAPVTTGFYMALVKTNQGSKVLRLTKM